MLTHDIRKQHSDCATCKALDTLLDGSDKQIVSAVVVAAHPDDEVIGLGSLLPRLRRAAFIYTTDGAPRDREDAAHAGFDSLEAYRDARRRELVCAFACAGITKPKIKMLPFVDKEASLDLVRLTRALAREFARTRPALIFTHAYEGGHPDHDATAFAVHHALHLYQSENVRREPPVLVEYTSYHEHENNFRCGAFLRHASAIGNCELRLELSPAARELKRNLFRCFASQDYVLDNFPVEEERFRCAQTYDFTQPPHAGRLHYETFGWGWTGAKWCSFAHNAITELYKEQDR
ncbi:MAG: PIG-L family deacetylase [Pyrinomonadaceae bacterium]|nr:PIG-L family deacetylase [Pyrinomonadaceae bacterium]